MSVTVSPALGAWNSKRWKHHVPRMAIGRTATSSGSPSDFKVDSAIMPQVAL